MVKPLTHPGLGFGLKFKKLYFEVYCMHRHIGVSTTIRTTLFQIFFTVEMAFKGMRRILQKNAEDVLLTTLGVSLPTQKDAAEAIDKTR